MSGIFYKGYAEGSIFLIATVTSLDSNMTQVLVPYATSSFNNHSLLSVIGIVSGVMIAVVKAPMAKIGDVFGRMEAFLLSVLLYFVGYIQMAASNNVETYAVRIHLTELITECCDILCGGINRTANNATNCHRRYFHSSQQGTVLVNP
jgi:MFS family permease